MSVLTAHRTIADDWYGGTVPANVALDDSAYLETSYSFLLYRSELPVGVEVGRGCTIYLGTMFDVGPRGRVNIGPYSLVNGAWFICDAAVEIGAYALISWNVVFMDNHRLPLDPDARRRELARLPFSALRRPTVGLAPKPIRVGRNVWIGFDCCILPGVTIGEGAIIGARSVVVGNVPPYTVAAGNPARLIRQIENDERNAAG